MKMYLNLELIKEFKQDRYLFQCSRNCEKLKSEHLLFHNAYNQINDIL